MSIVITVLHVVACFFLIVVVLLQTGKGADIGAVFGGSSQTIFGSSGAGNLLTRLTTWTAVDLHVHVAVPHLVATRHVTSSIVDTIPPSPRRSPSPRRETRAPRRSRARRWGIRGRRRRRR